MVGSDGGDTAEEGGGRGGGRNVVVGVAVVLLAFVVPWAAAWVVAWPGSRPWGPVLFALGCVAVAAALSGTRRLTPRGAAVGLTVGLVVVSSIAALWSYQSATLLRRRLEPELEQLALAAHNANSDDSRCQDLPSGPVVPGFGLVAGMCPGEHGTVFYGPTQSWVLIYVEDGIAPAPFPYGEPYAGCVAAVSTHWLERLAPDGRNCPAGFTEAEMTDELGY